MAKVCIEYDMTHETHIACVVQIVNTGQLNLIPTLTSLFRGSLARVRRLALHEGHAPFKGWLAKALAEETGKLQTWRFSIDDRSLCPLVSFVLTLDPSPTRTTINARND